MAKRKKELYPCVLQVEEMKNCLYRTEKRGIEEDPDFIGNAPNYDKYKAWSIEKTLAWLNID